MLKAIKVMIAAAVLAVSAGTALAQTPAKVGIQQIAGDLWRFKHNFHYSVFLVTPDGVIATDPINAGAAKWLKNKIKEQFNLPIKYLILSHDHADHSSGGEVFQQDGAIVIAHEKAKVQIIGERRPTAVPDVTFSDQMLSLIHI